MEKLETYPASKLKGMPATPHSYNTYVEEVKKLEILPPEIIRDMIKEYRNTNSKEVLKKIIESNIPLVDHILRTNFTYDVQDRLDYIDEGVFGIIDALKKYKLDSDACFSTYAYVSIKRKLASAIKKNESPVTQKKKYFEDIAKIEQVIHSYRKEHINNPTIDEIVELTGLTKGDVETTIAEKNNCNCLSLDYQMKVDDNTIQPLSELIPSDEDIENKILEKVRNEYLISQIEEAGLTELEKRALTLRYYFDSTEKQPTYQDIGFILCEEGYYAAEPKRQSVEAAVKRALKKIRNHFYELGIIPQEKIKKTK